MANPIAFLARRTAKRLADFAVSNPAIRWVWTGPGNEDYANALSEFRPTDRESVLEMMQGRYLLASKLVDTNGVSPFAVEMVHDDWLDDLQAFAWLRHFRDARTDEERAFARSLTLDWIDRDGYFDRTVWGLSLTARRVLNWLRHFGILVEGANDEDAKLIARSLGTQIQSLKLRAPFADDPVDALMAAMALLGVALCDQDRESEIVSRLNTVNALLDRQIDEDGLHRSRSAKVQLMLMVELTTLRQALLRQSDAYHNELSEVLESMHVALDAISLGTGEAAYFNGTGQMAHDIIVAVQAQNPARARSTGTAGGYGRLIWGKSIVVADSGLVPAPEYARHMHASALAFEFSHGRDLVVCNCGPAPADMEESELLFRQGIAHSCPTINALSAAAIPTRGPLRNRVVRIGRDPDMATEEADHSLVMRTHGYADRFGVVLERRLTLLAEGNSLVGQERMLRARGRMSGVCAIRFHLAHGTQVTQVGDMLKLRLSSGAVWNFLWEGADMRIEDSVRQSAYFGFHRTRQIVLDTLVDQHEVSWIFTLDEG
ncbi:MAG TPA: heparinase II/III family protein [Hypericibacter adhaerens]|uniref:heparinase II/III family protein n=1 Tax=Hypericibacter adhaerens TaxID=2602016 RepID=UPI002C3C00CE|nr:heparinase II/III family protein [Hypericibacter adhaerens]HWA42075.1 heparinase II/III family protein [Hypericibacter adhaerens]